MADKLDIYQGALRLLGSHQVASLVENIPDRLRLDEAWDEVVAYCLKRGLWNFATREAILSAHASAPTFGYTHKFTHPTDMVRVVAVSDQATSNQFELFENRAGFFYADVETLYLTYISNNASYGLNIAAWPQDFADVVKARLAFEVALPITGDEGKQANAFTLFERNLKTAKALDAIDERVRFKPVGRLVRARTTQRSRQHG